MANKIIPAAEVAGHFLAVLNKHAEAVPEERRQEFKAACLDSLGGWMFQGPTTGRKALRND